MDPRSRIMSPFDTLSLKYLLGEIFNVTLHVLLGCVWNGSVFARIRPISPDRLVRRTNAVDSTPCVVMGPVLELYFSENDTLKLIIVGRNGREYWMNPLFQHSESEYSKLF